MLLHRDESTHAFCWAFLLYKGGIYKEESGHLQLSTAKQLFSLHTLDGSACMPFNYFQLFAGLQHFMHTFSDYPRSTHGTAVVITLGINRYYFVGLWSETEMTQTHQDSSTNTKEFNMVAAFYREFDSPRFR